MLVEDWDDRSTEPEARLVNRRIIAESDGAPGVLHHVINARSKHSLDPRQFISCRWLLGSICGVFCRSGWVLLCRQQMLDCIVPEDADVLRVYFE